MINAVDLPDNKPQLDQVRAYANDVRHWDPKKLKTISTVNDLCHWITPKVTTVASVPECIQAVQKDRKSHQNTLEELVE